MKAHVLALLFVASCGGETSSQTATAPTGQTTTSATTTAAPTTPAATSATPTTTAPDLSTEDKARAAILDALKRDDKEGFKKLVSTRILSTRKDFDAWYAVWKSAADKHPDSFKKITVTKEGADFKLDEN